MPQSLSSKKTIRYVGGLLLRNHNFVREELWVRDGKIVAPQAQADITENIEGYWVAPGYIDLQVNGGFGYDFSTDSECIHSVATGLRNYGVTSFLPTLISSAPEVYRHLVPNLLQHPAVLGVHYEGPFLNPQKKGAHSKNAILPIDEINVERCYGSLQGAKLVTLSPEIPGALTLIKYLSSRGIVVAAGHTVATYEEALIAFTAGIRLVTHLFNAMTTLHHRAPGLAVATLIDPSVNFSMILDGLHVHSGMAKLAWEAAKERFILISDAMAALGLGDGLYRLGTHRVEVKENKVNLVGSKTLAGTILPLDGAVRSLRTITGCSAIEAIEAASLKPAQLLGIADKKGTLAMGADADFNLLDEQLNVIKCFTHYS